MTGVECILLTGGGGFVGGYVSAALAKMHPSAKRAILYQSEPANPVPGWQAFVADLTDDAALGDIVAALKPDLIVHLAAQSSAAEAGALAERTWRVNLGGTLSLAHAVARHSPRSTFFFASTAEVYGASFKNGIVSEATPPLPLNAYASSKLAGEHVLRDVLAHESRLVVARSFNHIGPGQDERFALPAFAAQIARIEAGIIPPVLRVGNLDAMRDFLDVRDVVNAYCRLVSDPGLPSRLTVNVASGHALRIGALLEQLVALSRVPFEIEQDPNRMRPSDIPHTAVDASLIRDRVGWSPEYSLNETLKNILDWWRIRVADEIRPKAQY